MDWMKNILREIFGLFVDDSAFAFAILIWLCVAGCAALYLDFSSVWAAIVLFSGFALILIESTSRYARQHRTRK